MPELLEMSKPKALLPEPTGESHLPSKIEITQSRAVTQRWENMAPKTSMRTEIGYAYGEKDGERGPQVSVSKCIAFYDKSGRSVYSTQVEGYDTSGMHPSRQEYTTSIDEEGRTTIIITTFPITHSGSDQVIGQFFSLRKNEKRVIENDLSYIYDETPRFRKVITLNKDLIPVKVVDYSYPPVAGKFTTEDPYRAIDFEYDKEGHLATERIYKLHNSDARIPGIPTSEEELLFTYHTDQYGGTTSCCYKYDTEKGKMVLDNVSDYAGFALLVKGNNNTHIPTDSLNFKVLSELFSEVTLITRYKTQLRNIPLSVNTVPYAGYTEEKPSQTHQERINHYLPEIKELFMRRTSEILDIARNAKPSREIFSYLLSLDFTEKLTTAASLMGVLAPE